MILFVKNSARTKNRPSSAIGGEKYVPSRSSNSDSFLIIYWRI
jgi:hypothetical protein